MNTTCKECGKKNIKNMKLHLLYAHGKSKKRQAKGELVETPDNTTLTKEDLLSKPKEEPGDQEYYCQDCMTPLKKGEPECPGCHQKLIWEAIEGK